MTPGIGQGESIFGAEERRVIDWRAVKLKRAGYLDYDAMTIALRADIDLHRAVALLRLGCPPETAVRILL
jgi:hypothetical protein